MDASYSPMIRLNEVRNLMFERGGLSVYDLAEEVGVSVTTARRYLVALEEMGAPVQTRLDDDGKTLLYSLSPTARKASVEMTVGQMLALSLGRNMFNFLEGTGFKEQLEDIFRSLASKLQSSRTAAMRHLDRKLYDIPEASYVYEGRDEDMDEILSALIYENKLSIRYKAQSKAAIVIEPYSLLTYRHGLYVYGRRDEPGRKPKPFSVDLMSDVQRLRKQKFEYPEDYDPGERFDGPFTLWGGKKYLVKIKLADNMKQRARRRQWHPGQKVRSYQGGVLMTMRVPLSPELQNWVLGFGEQAEVIAPKELRDAVVTRVMAMGRVYAR